MARHRRPKAEGDLPKRLAAQGDYRVLWYVYFLELSNDDIYVGSTNDLKRRFASHQAGDVPSTRAYRPARLKSYVAVETEPHARELEAYFKSGSGKAVALKRLIRRSTMVSNEVEPQGWSRKDTP